MISGVAAVKRDSLSFNKFTNSSFASFTICKESVNCRKLIKGKSSLDSVQGTHAAKTLEKSNGTETLSFELCESRIPIKLRFEKRKTFHSKLKVFRLTLLRV